MPLKAVEVMLDEAMRASLDEMARSRGMSRSAFVRQLVADHVRPPEPKEDRPGA